MGQSWTKALGDKEYITSDRWKCEKSPSGAHHWMIQHFQMTCRYCNSIKPVDMARSGWSKPADAK